jgi:hypothetical protein
MYRHEERRTGLLCLPAHYFGSLDSIHLRLPGSRRLELANGANVVNSVARNSDIIVAFQDGLDVADLKHIRFTGLSQAASVSGNGVDKLIREFANCLD